MSNWTGVLCFNRTAVDGYLHVRELYDFALVLILVLYQSIMNMNFVNHANWKVKLAGKSWLTWAHTSKGNTITTQVKGLAKGCHCAHWSYLYPKMPMHIPDVGLIIVSITHSQKSRG